MAIYYYIDLDCPPRRELGGEEILASVRELVMAEHVRAQVHEQAGPGIPDEEIRFKRRATTPDGGDEEAEMTVAEVEAAAAPLRELEGFCLDCPAAVTGAPYSCIQRIALPLTAEAERWLAGRIPPADSLCGQFLRASAEKLSLGECPPLDDWRKAGFLEAEEEAMALDGDIGSKALLHAALMSGDLAPANALSLLLFTQSLGTTDGGGADEALQAIQMVQLRQSAEGAPQLAFALEPSELDDPSVLDLKVFLAAAYRAFSLESSLAVRM